MSKSNIAVNNPKKFNVNGAIVKNSLASLWFAGLLVLAQLSLFGCDMASWNNPYPVSDTGKNILYSAFSNRPKHLDPAQSYSADEVVFTGQIYEPPLQYHFLKRPYQLVPLTTTTVPQATYYDATDNLLSSNASIAEISYTIYTLRIKPGIKYQPHPAFAKNSAGEFLYHELSKKQLADIFYLSDFTETDSRELTASDYVYEIKRLAHPRINSPILGLMSEYIDGLADYAKLLAAEDKLLIEKDGRFSYLDLRRYDFPGVTILDRYTYQIKIKGKYPQFLYWLAMPFFAPIPYEADIFYTQAGLDKNNINFDWYPVGTGPYMLTKNNPNLQMVLEKNPNFHGETYPQEGEASDLESGMLVDAGKALPFIDKIIYSREKESIPGWNKFLQGFYDASGISSDSFDQAISMNGQGDSTLTDSMRDKGISLAIGVETTTFYWGFNMKDSVVGGLGESAKKLRQAISIAINYEEYISIFLNGRGIAAQGPIPPGIFGFKDGEAGYNSVVYDWIDGQQRRKPISIAKKLLAEAGYPNGRDKKTGKPLIIYLDTPGSGPSAKALFDWVRKQFQKIDLQLVVRSSDYNRFRDKMLKGTAQLFQWGWNADYPDPENFLFLLYGPNAKVGKNGENAANYENPEFDKLFAQMKNMENSPQRQQIIDEMMKIAREDSPWIWGFHPQQFGLYHSWYKNTKANLMANNTLKYKRIYPQERAAKRAEWNAPILWPVLTLLALLVGGIFPAIITIKRRTRAAGIA